MTRILVKRVYDVAGPDDGYRVFIDRLWPRGMRKGEFGYDLWAKNIAPSDALRRWYHADPLVRWAEFRKKYAEELRCSPAIKEFVCEISAQPTVTLLFGAKDRTRNHAVVLQEFLQKALEHSQLAATTA